eukprot:TRINITY_DN2059_c0_g4_i1.p1 TRINITY_DN2059_c0_g4~~TRINITY_DN2059_c0_g4_i1.p1  ORF type:complete len:143 (-),score=14.12 TRINITY_DN2059_c0_g4_i1:137-565(-)
MSLASSAKFPIRTGAYGFPLFHFRKLQKWMVPTYTRPKPEHIVVPGHAYKVAYMFPGHEGTERRNFYGRCLAVKGKVKSTGRSLHFWNVFFGCPVEFIFQDPSPWLEYVDRISNIKPVRRTKSRLYFLKESNLEKHRVKGSI